jgi:hypothetical protein
MIADRTKAGFEAAKARGIKLGNAKLAVDNQGCRPLPRRSAPAGFAELGEGSGHLEWPPNCDSGRGARP